MATTSFRGDPVDTSGETPATGSAAPAYSRVRGLLARSVAPVVDADSAAPHTQVVPDVAIDPDHDAALAALG
jgi:peroxiredoxin